MVQLDLTTSGAPGTLWMLLKSEAPVVWPSPASPALTLGLLLSLIPSRPMLCGVPPCPFSASKVLLIFPRHL